MSPRCGKGGTDVQRGGLAERGTGDTLCFPAPRDAQGTGGAQEGLQHRLPSTGLGAGGVSAGKRPPAVPDGRPGGVSPLCQGPRERGGLKKS